MTKWELENFYWGPNWTPNEWHTVQECAEFFNRSPEAIVEAIKGHGIRWRPPEIEIHKQIWEVLEKRFRMMPQTHFLYQTEMNRVKVDFYVVNESVGIKIDPKLPVWEIKTLHVGNSMIVKVGCSEPEEMANRLERQLRDLGVKVRYVRDAEEDEGEW